MSYSEQVVDTCPHCSGDIIARVQDPRRPGNSPSFVQPGNPNKQPASATSEIQYCQNCRTRFLIE